MQDKHSPPNLVRQLKRESQLRSAYRATRHQSHGNVSTGVDLVREDQPQGLDKISEAWASVLAAPGRMCRPSDSGRDHVGKWKNVTLNPPKSGRRIYWFTHPGKTEGRRRRR